MGDGAVIKLASALWHMAFLNATHIQKHTAKSPSRVEVYYNGKTGNAPYTVATSRSAVVGNNNKHIDAGCKRGLMSLANGSRGMSGANARFVDNIRPDKTIAVKATKNIRHNKEIVVHYGKLYFDSMKKNTNKTK